MELSKFKGTVIGKSGARWPGRCSQFKEAFMSEFISFNFVETDSKNCTGYMMLAKDGFWIHKEDAIKAMKASSNSLQH